MKRIDNNSHVGERGALRADRGAVALVRIDRHDLDLREPAGVLYRHPRLEMFGVTAFEHVNDLPPWSRPPRRSRTGDAVASTPAT